MMVAWAGLLLMLVMLVFVAGVAVAIVWARHRRQTERRGFEVKPGLPADEGDR